MVPILFQQPMHPRGMPELSLTYAYPGARLSSPWPVHPRWHTRALSADSGDNPHVLDLTVAAPAAAFLLPLPGLMARMQEKIWKMACVFSKAINVTSTKLTEIRNWMRRAILQDQTTMRIYCQKKKNALAGTCRFSISDFSHNAQDQLDFMYGELDRISVIYVLVMVACKDHAFCGSYLVSIVNNYVPTSNCPMYTNWTLKLFQPVHVCFVLLHSAKQQGGLVEACIKKLWTYYGLWMGQSEEGSFFKVAF